MTDVIDEFLKSIFLVKEDEREIKLYVEKLESWLRKFFYGDRRNILIKVPDFYSLEQKIELCRKMKPYGETKPYKNIGYIRLYADKSSFKRFFEHKKAGKIKNIISAYASQPKYLPFTKKGHGEASLWNISMVGADKVSINSNYITVGIIDSGVNYEHPDLVDRYEGGYDFLRNKSDPMDYNGHGTHCAGIITGKNTGVSNCRFMAYRVLDSEGMGDESDILQAMDKALEDRVYVINMSYGSSFRSYPEEDACMACIKAGIILVAAAGNEGYGESYPACYPGVVGVASCDRNKMHSIFSNINNYLSITAPGEDIYSTYWDEYETMSGTSMAAPHITGIMASAIASQIIDPINKMKSTAEKIGDCDPRKYGAGLARIDRMVMNYARNKSFAFKR